MISPTNISANEYRCQDLLAEAARARLIKAGASADPTEAKPSSVARVRASACQLLGALASISLAFRSNRPAAA